MGYSAERNRVIKKKFMKNNQINFFKSGDFNTILKPLGEDFKTFREERIVKIDKYEIKETSKELDIGVFGWYAISFLSLFINKCFT